MSALAALIRRDIRIALRVGFRRVQQCCRADTDRRTGFE